MTPKFEVFRQNFDDLSRSASSQYLQSYQMQPIQINSVGLTLSYNYQRQFQTVQKSLQSAHLEQFSELTL